MMMYDDVWMYGCMDVCMYVCMYSYIYVYFNIGSRQNPLHLSSYYYNGCRFWRGANRFTEFRAHLTKVFLQYYSGLQPF